MVAKTQIAGEKTASAIKDGWVIKAKEILSELFST